MRILSPRPEAAAYVRQAVQYIREKEFDYSCNALEVALDSHAEREHLLQQYHNLFWMHPWFTDRTNPNHFTGDGYTHKEKQADRIRALEMFADMLEKGTLP